MADYSIPPSVASASCMPRAERLVDVFPQRLPSRFMVRMVYNRANPTGQNVLASVPGDTIPYFLTGTLECALRPRRRTSTQ